MVGVIMKYILDVHCHSVSSGHAYSTITENINYAKNIGLKLIAITDHAPKMPGSCTNLHFLNLNILPKKVNDLEILTGVELNILDINGKVDLPNSILKSLDLKIASLHPPCITPSDNINDNTEAVINTMKNPLVNIIGHLGDPRYPINIDKIVKASLETNTLIEINNSSLSPNNTRSGGKDTILEILNTCKKLNVPIILGSDAHYHTYIGNFDNIIPLLNKCNFPEELIVNTSIEKFKNFYLNIL